jgi:hypothetical protein
VCGYDEKIWWCSAADVDMERAMGKDSLGGVDGTVEKEISISIPHWRAALNHSDSPFMVIFVPSTWEAVPHDEIILCSEPA